MAGPFAGSYDPVRATIYTPTSSIVNGEYQNTKEVFCTRYIRFKKGYSKEQEIQDQTTSSNIHTLLMRRDSKTETIKSNMTIIHRDIEYGILGTIKVNYSNDEIEIKVESKESV